jgi:hypothetical protein
LPTATPTSPGTASSEQATLTPIEQQALIHKNAVKQQSEMMQRSLLDSASAHAKYVEEQARQEAESISWRRGSGAMQALLKQEGAQQASQALNVAKYQAAQAKKMAEDKQKALDESASNLNDLMNTRVGNSKVHLKPEGTSLYIRNYGQ